MKLNWQWTSQAVEDARSLDQLWRKAPRETTCCLREKKGLTPGPLTALCRKPTPAWILLCRPSSVSSKASKRALSRNLRWGEVVEDVVMHKLCAGNQEEGKGLCGRRGHLREGLLDVSSCVGQALGCRRNQIHPTCCPLFKSCHRPEGRRPPGARERTGTPRPDAPPPLADLRRPLPPPACLAAPSWELFQATPVPNQTYLFTCSVSQVLSAGPQLLPPLPVFLALRTSCQYLHL